MTALMEQQDSTQALFRNARGGDRHAFDALASRFRGRLSTFVRLRLGTGLRRSVEVDDVLQESLLRAFRSIGNAEFETRQAFFSWLTTITERVIIDFARRYGARPSSPLDHDVAGEDVSASRGLKREERFERLQQALDSLSPDDREAIVLARIQGLPLKEIAQRMHRSHAAVAQLLSRALKKLRSSFGDTESLNLPHRSLNNEEAGSE